MAIPKVRRRPNMRRAVILFPSGLTLGNLFCGIGAIISASRGEFRTAGIWVLWGGILDALDGRVARATNAGSQFGEELDSLVDAVSFGVAPAMIMYFAVLNRDGWDWVWAFAFVACAVMRLARFNIEQAGTAKTYFQGLPSPAAGCTLASYYWFSQSSLYSYGAIGNLPWQEMLRFLIIALAALMISNIPYPVFPRTGFRSIRALGASLLVLGAIALLATKRLEFFFPLTLSYVAWGPIRWVFGGLLERRQPTIPYDLSEGEDDEEDDEEFEMSPSQVHASRRGHRPAAAVLEERPARNRGREEAAVRAPKSEDRPARPARPDREDRPQRTDEERAARKAKREKRDLRTKREGRPERPERPRDEQPTASTVAPTVPVILVDATAGPTVEGEVIGRISSEDADGTTPSAEVRARKRKRRRRRGERKDRPAGTAGDASAGSSAADDNDDGGDDEGGTDDHHAADDHRSPYAAPAQSPAPSSPAPADHAAPHAPPSAPSSHEPFE